MYISDKFPNKSSAEKHAASIALDDIYQSKKFIELNLKKVCIFIDLENRQTDVFDFLDNVKSEGVSIIGFISHEHTLINKFRLIEDKRFKLIEIPSTRKDAADIGLSFILGYHIFAFNFDLYIIISGDHFAKVLEECINSKIICSDVRSKLALDYLKSHT
jgi:hypothetical protein